MRAAKAIRAAEELILKGYFVRQLKLFAWQAVVLGGVSAAYLAVAAFMPAEVLAVMYSAYLWAICPVLGGWLTVRAVLKGMQPYLALWALPLVPAAVQLLVTGTPMDMAAVLAYALVGLICSATGDELRRRRERGSNDQRRR